MAKPPSGASAAPLQFRWFELATTDAKGAEAFYVPLIGWNAFHLGPMAAGYVTYNTPQGGIAGMRTIKALDGPPHWMGLVAVENVDQTLERVKAAGGRVVHAPVNIPGLLRMAPVEDPMGARFTVYKAVNAEGPLMGGPDMTGHIGWHELWTPDVPRALAFYRTMFGWRKTRSVETGPGQVYQLWTDGRGDDAGGMTAVPEGATSSWTYNIQVDGIDTAVERIRAGGGQVLYNGPRQIPTGDWVVQGLDPQGGLFSLVSRVK